MGSQPHTAAARRHWAPASASPGSQRRAPACRPAGRGEPRNTMRPARQACSLGGGVVWSPNSSKTFSRGGPGEVTQPPPAQPLGRAERSRMGEGRLGPPGHLFFQGNPALPFSEPLTTNAAKRGSVAPHTGPIQGGCDDKHGAPARLVLFPFVLGGGRVPLPQCVSRDQGAGRTIQILTLPRKPRGWPWASLPHRGVVRIKRGKKHDVP